jgi:hypothetical protein
MSTVQDWFEMPEVQAANGSAAKTGVDKAKAALKDKPITHVNCPECNNESVNVEACKSCSKREGCEVRPAQGRA